MAKNVYDYKTVKISEKAHELISKIADKENVSIKDLIETLGTFYLKSGLSLSELEVSFKADKFNNLEFSINKNIDRIISILKVHEKAIHAPVFRMTSIIYKDVSYLTNNISMQISSQEDDNEPEQRGEIPIEDKKNRDLQQKNELIELRIEKAKELLSNVINKATSSVTGGKVRRFNDEEINEIKDFISKCTIL